jgi:cytochrome P450
MTETTFHVISSTMFAGSADQEAATIMEAADATLATISWDVAAALLGLPNWMWVPGRLRRRRGGRRLRSAVATIIARRRKEGLDGTDLLARLASASHPDSGAPMSDARLIDNLVTFLEAGHETTAKALTWALYLLARAPHWQERIRAEVREVTSGQPIDASHIDRLLVTRAVLKEAMRLYPPAPIITRIAAEDTELAGQAVPAGSLIFIPIFAVHRHRRLWTDADRFDPDRFTPEREAGYTRTQFMPFGFGARTCIGMSFAMLEGIALLATLVAHARFGWDGRHVPEPISRVTLRPQGGMPLAVWPHDDAT